MARKITDRIVKVLPAPARGNRITYDVDVKGFGVRVTAAGGKSFVLNYRRKNDGLERRWTLGSFPDWSVGAAREEAKRLKREIDGGGDPVGDHRTDRSAPTVANLCTRFEEEYLPRLRPSTQISYRQQIAADILPVNRRSNFACRITLIADSDASPRPALASPVLARAPRSSPPDRPGFSIATRLAWNAVASWSALCM